VPPKKKTRRRAPVEKVLKTSSGDSFALVEKSPAMQNFCAKVIL